MKQHRKLSHWFSDDEYSRILDDLVIVCVDTLLYHKKHGIFLGKRRRLPLYDWWIFGGRMHANENYYQAAKRGIEREVGLLPEKQPEIIDYFDLIWEMREEKPQENGCHVLLVAMKCELSDEEASKVKIIGHDHDQGRWFSEKEVQKLNSPLKDIITKSNIFSSETQNSKQNHTVSNSTHSH